MHVSHPNLSVGRLRRGLFAVMIYRATLPDMGLTICSLGTIAPTIDGPQGT